MRVSAPVTPRFVATQLLEVVDDMRRTHSRTTSDIRCVFVIDY